MDNGEFRKAFPVALILALALGLALRMSGLGAEELWEDEAASVMIARQPASAILAGEMETNNPPIYFLMLKAWMKIAGDGESGVRSLSVAVGLLMVLLVGIAGLRLHSAEAGFFGALFAALLPAGIYYSQEARCYGLLALFAFLYVWSVIEMSLGKGKTWALLMGTAGAGLALTHAWGWFMLPYPLLFLKALRKRGALWSAVAAGAAVFICGLAVWLPAADRGGMEIAGWVADAWKRDGAAGSMLGTYRALTTGGDYPGVMFRLRGVVGGGILGALASVVIAMVAVSGIISRGSARGVADEKQQSEPVEEKEDTGRIGLWIGAAVAVPLALGCMVSAAGLPVYITGRTDYIAAPAMCLLLGIGTAAFRRFAVVAAAIVSIAGMSAGLDLYGYYNRAPMSVWSGTAEYLHENLRKEDSILCIGVCAPLIYYMEKVEPGRGIEPFPSMKMVSSHSHDQALMLKDAVELRKETDAMASGIMRSVKADGRVAVVTHGFYLKLFEKLAAALSGDFYISGVQNPAGSEIFILERRGLQ